MRSPSDIDELRRRVRSGEAFRHRLFYGHTPRADGQMSDAVFSQFWPSRFEIGGEEYRWAEQWMMASKARLFADDASAGRIMAASTAAECKRFGREVARYDDARWEAARFGLVVAGNLAKFGQAPDLRAHLIATSDEILVEAAPRDPVWGIGLDRDDPRARDPVAWQGLNLLGFALMTVRETLLTRAEMG